VAIQDNLAKRHHSLLCRIPSLFQPVESLTLQSMLSESRTGPNKDLRARTGRLLAQPRRGVSRARLCPRKPLPVLFTFVPLTPNHHLAAEDKRLGCLEHSRVSSGAGLVGSLAWGVFTSSGRLSSARLQNDCQHPLVSLGGPAQVTTPDCIKMNVGIRSIHVFLDNQMCRWSRSWG
jgi:hypothetical protein